MYVRTYIFQVENKVRYNIYNPIRISDKRIQCGSSCNLTIEPKEKQSAQSIVKGFNFIKPSKFEPEAPA